MWYQEKYQWIEMIWIHYWLMIEWNWMTISNQIIWEKNWCWLKIKLITKQNDQIDANKWISQMITMKCDLTNDSSQMKLINNTNQSIIFQSFFIENKIKSNNLIILLSQNNDLEALDNLLWWFLYHKNILFQIFWQILECQFLSMICNK